MREFWEATNMHCVRACGCFDMHGVADQLLCREEAKWSGISLDHVDDTMCVILSFGFSHRKDTVFPSENVPWDPFINEMDGYIFTDYRDGRVGERKDRWCQQWQQYVYREEWMPVNAFSIKGCKGHLPWLFGTRYSNMPCLLFDDKRSNLHSLTRRDDSSRGILVTRKYRNFSLHNSYTWDHQFKIVNHPLNWAAELEDFVASVRGSQSWS